MKKIGFGNILLSVLWLCFGVVLFDPDFYRRVRLWFLGAPDNNWARQMLEHSASIFFVVTAIFLSLLVYFLFQYSKKFKKISVKKIMITNLISGFVIGVYAFAVDFLWMDELQGIWYAVEGFVIPMIISSMLCFVLWLSGSYFANQKNTR